jgi:hypothetical protein
MKYADLSKAIQRTEKLIALTEQKLATLKELLASLKFAKANGIVPENITTRQLDLPF